MHDPDLVIPAIAEAMGLREEGRQPIFERLQTHLRNQQALLLLDNFEQMAAAAVRLVPLLTACPALKVLVTSRVALRVHFATDTFPAASFIPNRLTFHVSWAHHLRLIYAALY